jgi:hypothetical protein
MTPKEKAQELVSKMLSVKMLSMRYEHAKQFALITADEMLGLGSMVGSDLSDLFYIYWEEVKQEIKNL